MLLLSFLKQQAKVGCIRHVAICVILVSFLLYASEMSRCMLGYLLKMESFVYCNSPCLLVTHIYVGEGEYLKRCGLNVIAVLLLL